MLELLLAQNTSLQMNRYGILSPVFLLAIVTGCQEHFRQAPEAIGYGYNITESISSNIDDTTMHELYLWPFADAIRAGVGSIMCSYNQINNSYGCQNSKLLNNILKDELGFQGFVMSDWQAQHTGAASAAAGLDSEYISRSFFWNFWIGESRFLLRLRGSPS